MSYAIELLKRELQEKEMRLIGLNELAKDKLRSHDHVIALIGETTYQIENLILSISILEDK